MESLRTIKVRMNPSCYYRYKHEDFANDGKPDGQLFSGEWSWGLDDRGNNVRVWAGEEFWCDAKTVQHLTKIRNQSFPRPLATLIGQRTEQEATENIDPDEVKPKRGPGRPKKSEDE